MLVDNINAGPGFLGSDFNKGRLAQLEAKSLSQSLMTRGEEMEYAALKKERLETPDWIHPTGNHPQFVTMLLLGESKRQYGDMLATNHNRIFPPASEVWTCNAGFRVWRHDLLFVMDDLEGEAHKWPSYGDDLARHNRPIITSTAYRQWPLALEYPLGQICQALELTGLDRYFFNTVPYMLAYALFIGVKQVTIFGADYWHPAVPAAREADLANTEWWLGYLRAKGVNIVLGSDTTLMRARESGRPLYGYRHDPRAALDRAATQSAKPLASASVEDEKPHDLSPAAEAFVTQANNKRRSPIIEAAKACVPGEGDVTP